jgi:hypothetical protein
VKTRKWPYVVGAIVVLLLFLYAIGAASAYKGESGDGGPLALLTTVGVALVAAAIVALILRARVPSSGKVAAKPGVVQFTISPLEPFTTSIADARWRLGDGSPLPKFGSFARPLISTGSAGITIWRSGRDALPLVTIPAASVQSIASQRRKIQVSRIGVTGSFLCIVVELMIGSTGVTLILPACTPVNETVPGTQASLDAWVAQMRDTLESQADQPRLRG